GRGGLGGGVIGQDRPEGGDIGRAVLDDVGPVAAVRVVEADELTLPNRQTDRAVDSAASQWDRRGARCGGRRVTGADRQDPDPKGAAEIPRAPTAHPPL